MSETTNTLLTKYSVPFMSGDYNINLHLYNESNHREILFNEKYYEEIPSKMLAGKPSAVEMEKFSLEMDDEFVICINEDICPPEQRLAALAECLFYAATEAADRVESEEFGARVIGDAYKTMASLLDPSLSTAAPSPVRGLVVSEYGIPLVSENYRVSLNMYDESNRVEVVMKLRDVYRESMLGGQFNPVNNRGFVAEPTFDELAVFVNCEQTTNLLEQQTILAHELFHASRKVARTFDESTELGAQIYRTLFEQFMPAMGTATDSQSA